MSSVVRSAEGDAGNITATDVSAKKGLDVNIINASLPVSVAAAPLAFRLDGVETDVNEDTGTPADSTPLPVKLLTDSGTPVDFATEATLQDVLDQVTDAAADLSTIAAEDFATQTTLAALNAKVTAADTDDVTITGALPAGNNNIGDVDVASLPALPAGSNTIGSVDLNYLTIVDFIDSAVGPVLNAASNTIQDNAGAFLEVVASLAATVKKIRVADTTGAFIGLYTGDAASESLAFIINPGQSNECDLAIASGTRVSVRSMGGTDITEGELCIQFLG